MSAASRDDRRLSTQVRPRARPSVRIEGPDRVMGSSMVVMLDGGTRHGSDITKASRAEPTSVSWPGFAALPPARRQADRESQSSSRCGARRRRGANSVPGSAIRASAWLAYMGSRACLLPRAVFSSSASAAGQSVRAPTDRQA